VNAPYVDILVADKFAAEVGRALADAFGIRIVRSLEDVMHELSSLDASSTK
jgi:hypothetical protein